MLSHKNYSADTEFDLKRPFRQSKKKIYMEETLVSNVRLQLRSVVNSFANRFKEQSRKFLNPNLHNVDMKHLLAMKLR
jgi:hypothetical protein